MNQRELLKLIEEAAHSNQTTLDLSGHQLTFLPPEIGQLTNLTLLSLSFNQLTSLPPEIGQLTNLKKLFLYKNQLTSLPLVFSLLTNLRQLYLYNNQLTSLPPEIGQLTNLKELYLYDNQLLSLPPEIGQLDNLTRLDLQKNSLTSLPPEFGQLKNLTILNLYDNQLTSLPPEIGQLTNLKELYLYDNQLLSLPPEIGQLNNLTRLDVQHNSLSSLPAKICQLTKLQGLSLNGNQLTSLPTEVGQLNNLMKLQLWDNQLTSLPTEIGQLINMRSLTIHKNGLTSLPPEIGQLTNLKSFELFDNPLPTETFLVFQKGLPALLDYLHDLTEENSPVYEVKLVLVGEGDVGKTTLLRALQGKTPQKNNPSTEAIDISREPVPLPHANGKNAIALNAWDFGGQKIYRITHQFFFSEKAVYLLIWDPRSGPGKCDVAGWLERIKLRVGEDARVLIVSTYADDKMHPPRISESQLRRDYGDIIVGFYAVDGMEYANSSEMQTALDNLKQAIADAASPISRRVLPASWQRARTAIKAREDACMSVSHFVEICKEHGLSELSASSLAEIMNELGDVVYFANAALDAGAFGEAAEVTGAENIVILKPQWLAKAIGFVMEDKKTDDGTGELLHRELPRIWYRDRKTPDIYPTHLHPFFLWLMEKFNVSYRLSPHKSLVPQRITSTRPDDLYWLPGSSAPTGEREVTLICRMSENPPPGIVPLMIVQSHVFRRKQDEGLDKNWQEGAFFNRGEHGTAFMELNDRELLFKVRGHYPDFFCRELRKSLVTMIADYWPGLNYTLVVPCPGCIKRGGSYRGRFRIEALEEAKKQGESNYRCQDCNELQSITQMLEGIEPSLEKLLHDLKQSHKRELSIAMDAYRWMLNALGAEDRRAPSMFSLDYLGQTAMAEKFRLTLWCEWPDGPHACCQPGSGGSGEYEFEQSREWLIKAKPYIEWSARILKVVLPGVGAGLKESLDTTLLDDLKPVTDLIDITSRALPTGEMDVKRGANPELGHKLRPEGDALRLFHDLLRDLNEKEGRKWGDLRPVLNKANETLWLCPKHAEIYDPPLPQVP